ncbi:MAG: hypothetical protein N3E49_02430 [Bacteroidia bacterium]|nr:hypothetical protein [Bacteroidia bacterium]
MGRWPCWLFLSLIGLWGCGSRALVFTTPYDKELYKALRQRRTGWVKAGVPSDISPHRTQGYLFPGQFIRIVTELAYPVGSEIESMQKVRIDTVRIFEDSLTYLPWAGSVRLGGLSIDSAQIVLEAVASRLFAKARLRIYPLYVYYVFGQVSQQGRVFFDKPEIPLTEVLALTPIQSREVDYSRVKVLRGPPRYDEVFLVDARSADILTSRFMVRSEDIIIFEQRGIVRSRIEFQNVLTLLGILQVVNLVLFFITIFR